jgi:hypothetical protein
MPAKKKETTEKEKTEKGTTKKNKLGVKNSLVNNINAKKKKGTSKSKDEKTVSKKAYDEMEDGWDKKKSKD